VRVFKTKPFARFARRAGLTDADLRHAIDAAERGLADADLGGGVLKQRIARAGGGKSGGFRTIVLFRAGSRAVFVHGFAKSERANIRDDELAAFRMLAAELLGYNEQAIARAMAVGVLIEVTSDEQ
jgi:hypothetical protein